jgi:mannose-1-phosphate guanylyltransferase
LIIAGGIGTRFWPKSTEKKPKQFLNLIGDKTMIQYTYERMLKIMPKERIFILTAEKYITLLKNQINDVDDKNIIIQPEIKNTAPGILLSSLYIKQIYPHTNIAVLPSDALIVNNDRFCDIILQANKFVEEENQDAIITIGITPNRPETGYGYIKYNNKEKNNSIIKVEEFVEKPTEDVAITYLKAGNYLWNAGIFIYNVDYMLGEFEEKYTNTFNKFKRLPKIGEENYNEKVSKIYSQAEEISVDYAIMEKSNSIYVIPGDFGWDDIGSWTALKRYTQPDENNNVLKGNVKIIDSKNNTVYADNKKIILFGINDIFCIDSDDAIVIGSADKLCELHDLRKNEKLLE